MIGLAARIVASIVLAWTTVPAGVRSGPQPPAPPERDGPRLPLESAWPARAGAAAGDSPGVIRPIDAAPTALALHPVLLPADRPPTEEDRGDLVAALPDGGPDVRVELEGPNSLLFVESRTRARRGIGVGPGPDAGPFGGFAFKFVSVERRADSLALQRTWFAWYDALDGSGKPAPDRASRAALVMPGLFGNPEPVIDRFILHLRQRGYGVLRMLAQPSRFTERITFVIDPGDLDGAARSIAQTLGDRAAECAYAADAARRHVIAQRPLTARTPWVIVGMSGGAMTLPTVYARSPGEFRAAVMIGGTADFWLTNERSNYRAVVDAVRVSWTAEPGDLQRASLDRRYLDSAPLDSFHTAGALRDRAVLMLQGTIDLAAPSALGDVLWERCGRPERWTYPVGHELLFAGLPEEFDRITTWLDAALGAPGDEGGAGERR